MPVPFPPDKDDFRPLGVDISRYNSNVDFEKMAEFRDPPIEYIMIRSGQGRLGNYDDLDSSFYYNWEHASEYFPRMAYHVLYPSEYVPDQVANVNRIFKSIDYDFGEGPLWIDFELHHNMNPVSLTNACKQFYDALIAEFDIRVGIYSGNWFLKARCQPQAWWAEVDWWMAHYWTSEEHDGPPDKPDIIPLNKIKFHQTTSWGDGMLLGAPVLPYGRIDLNRYMGENLYEYLDYEEVPTYSNWWASPRLEE
jgi:GH25 family lysozyme M1 (1,4-beta-N-acetylmuramidase)